MAPKKSADKGDKPKKKLSGYMAFAKDRRPALLKEKPNLSFGEVSACPDENSITPTPPPPDNFVHKLTDRLAKNPPLGTLMAGRQGARR